MQLKHLFDADVQYRPDMAAIVSADGRDGELIGSGDGVVRGQVSGKFRFSNFENQHGDFCEMYPAALIETDDGTSIPFDAKGYALRVGDGKWKFGLALKFNPSDERYAWLGETPGFCQGEFSEETGQSTWRVYVGVSEPSPAAFRSREATLPSSSQTPR